MTTVALTKPTHPEVPMGDWVTLRREDDGGLVLTDMSERSIDGFRILREQLHWRETAGDDWQHGPENFTVFYDLEWGDGVDREQFCILPCQIPALIAILQAARTETVK